MTAYLVSKPRPATDNPADYVNLADYNARRQTIYLAGDCGTAEVRAALEGVRAALQGNPAMLLSDAIEAGVPNVDEGARYISNYDLRQIIGRKCAAMAGTLAEAGKPRKPANIVAALLAQYEARQQTKGRVPAEAAA